MRHRRKRKSVVLAIVRRLLLLSWGDVGQPQAPRNASGYEHAPGGPGEVTGDGGFLSPLPGNPNRRIPGDTTAGGRHHEWLRIYLFVMAQRVSRFVRSYKLYVFLTACLVAGAFVNIRAVTPGDLRTASQRQTAASLERRRVLAHRRFENHSTQGLGIWWSASRGDSGGRAVVEYHDRAAKYFAEERDRSEQKRDRVSEAEPRTATRYSPEEAERRQQIEQLRCEQRWELSLAEIARDVPARLSTVAIAERHERRAEKLQLQIAGLSLKRIETTFDPHEPAMLCRVFDHDPLSLSLAELNVLKRHFNAELRESFDWETAWRAFCVYRLSLPAIEIPRPIYTPLRALFVFMIFLALGRDLRPSVFTRLLRRVFRRRVRARPAPRATRGAVA